MQRIFTLVPRWLPALVMMAVIFYFSSQPGRSLPDFLSWDRIVKKGGHITGYALLALAYLHWLGYDKKRYWLTWVLTILYAVTDEFHQSFVAGRNASILDVVIFDNFGATLGLWLYAKISPSADS